MPSITDHLRSPEITIDDHSRAAQIALGEYLADKHPVYLDTKYWIILRDAHRSLTSSMGVGLLRSIRRGVAEGKIFCPISEPLFVELLKQTDPVCRSATASLVDELSLGATLIDERLRIGSEITHLIYKNSGLTDLHPLKHLVWCKLSYVMGMFHPTQPTLTPEIQRALQKAFFDHMWMMPLSEIVAMIGSEAMPVTDLTQVANNLNAGIATYSTELRSFNQAYSAEVRGLVDLSGGAAADAIESIAAKKGIQLSVPAAHERRECENELKNLLAIVLEKGPGRQILRTMHILASLHASLRWNKGQKFKCNDFFDFEHAAAALAYCDVFLTERPLCAMITQKHLGLDKLYGCKVAAELSDAVALIENLE